MCIRDRFITAVEYLLLIPGMMYLIVGFFTVLGGIVGQLLSCERPLRGYGINLAGSLAGILVFTLVSFLGLPPAIWLLIGFLASLPFFIRDRVALAAFALIVGIAAVTQFGAYWSPYYRISVSEVPPPEGWQRPAAYFVDVNHDYHQKMLDLSNDFVSRFPNVEPNHSGLATYELPYRLSPNPGRVLVIGAGTGNDVAAAVSYTHLDVYKRQHLRCLAPVPMIGLENFENEVALHFADSLFRDSLERNRAILGELDRAKRRTRWR